MFSFFKRRRIGKIQLKAPGYFSKMLNPLLMRFASWLNRQEKRYSITQKKAILIVFCVTIVAIHFFNIYLGWKSSTAKNRFPEHNAITTPKDITLPDSLDIELIKLYREMKRKQDSLNSNKGK
jgi:hypothetical protein